MPIFNTYNWPYLFNLPIAVTPVYQYMNKYLKLFVQIAESLESS